MPKIDKPAAAHAKPERQLDRFDVYDLERAAKHLEQRVEELGWKIADLEEKANDLIDAFDRDSIKLLVPRLEALLEALNDAEARREADTAKAEAETKKLQGVRGKRP